MHRYQLSRRDTLELMRIYETHDLNEAFLYRYARYLRSVEVDDKRIHRQRAILHLNLDNPPNLADIKDLMHLLGVFSRQLRDLLTYYVPNYNRSFNRADYIRDGVQQPRFKLNDDGQPELSMQEMRKFRKLLLLTDDFHDLYGSIQSLVTPLLVKEHVENERLRAELRELKQNADKR